MDGWSPSGPRFLGGMEVSMRRRCRVRERNPEPSVAKVGRYMTPKILSLSLSLSLSHIAYKTGRGRAI